MPNRYHQIPLSEAKPGMTLSDAVLDTKGNILLPKGSRLTDAVIASLLRHQIDTVAIAGAEVSAEEVSAQSDARIARLAYLFRQPGTGEAVQPEHAATALLHRYILNFRSGNQS